MKRTLGQMLMLVLVVGLVGCGDAGFVVQSPQSEIGALTPESETPGTDSDGATTGGDSGENGTFKIECNADRSECAYQKMPLYSQTDGRLPNSLRMTATGNNLCAPTSLTMVLDTLMSYSNIKFKSSGLFETRFRDRDVYKEQIPNMVDLMQAGMASDTIAANGSNGGHFANFLAGYAELDGAEPVALSAMRTALVAFGVGALVMAWRGTNERRRRILVLCLLGMALALGAAMVARTRAAGALRLGDDSSSFRWQIARAALLRIPERPLLGHGLDAVKLHWHALE